VVTATYIYPTIQYILFRASGMALIRKTPAALNMSYYGADIETGGMMQAYQDYI
jgi:hypothetical protein